jgi:uncharacterized protein (TIGR02001 family)
LSVLFVLAPLCAAAPAWAQMGMSASFQTDYIYRGRSLTEGRPALTVAASYDHDSGLYAGASATAQNVAGEEGVEIINRVIYGGYVVQPKAGPAVDLGVTSVRTVSYRNRRRAFDYQEVYAGVLSDHLSFHLHYSPDYYESGIHTIYADLGAVIRPTEETRLFAHAGALTGVGGRRGPGSRKTRYDFSLGAARRFDNLELSLTWTRMAPALRFGGERDRDALVAGVAFFF